jgi:hypothetical protein
VVCPGDACPRSLSSCAAPPGPPLTLSSVKGLHTETDAAVQADRGVRVCTKCWREERVFATAASKHCVEFRQTWKEQTSRLMSERVCFSCPTYLQAPGGSAVLGDLVAGAECMPSVGVFATKEHS